MNFSVKGGITQLEKSAKLFTSILQDKYENVELEVFRNGKLSDVPSYIEITVEDNNIYEYLTVRTNSYDFEVKSWKEIKQDFLKLIEEKALHS